MENPRNSNAFIKNRTKNIQQNHTKKNTIVKLLNQKETPHKWNDNTNNVNN